MFCVVIAFWALLMGNRMKYAVSAVALAAALGFAGVAHAGGSLKDEPIYESPAEWSGFYFGGHLGAGWGTSDVSREDGPPGPPGFSFDTDPDGVLVGGQIGYDWQADRVVVGVIGDLSVAAIDGEGSKPDGEDGPPAAFHTEYDWIATVRARLGYLLAANALIYLHGGVAIADLGFEGIGGEGPWSEVFSEDTQTGWTAGAGLEYAVSPGMSLFAEYSYMDFDDQDFTPDGPPGTIEQESDLHVVKFGFNVKVR